MAPKQIVIGAGYQADQFTPEMTQLVDDLSQMTLTDVDRLDAELTAENETIKMKQSLAKDRRRQIEQEQNIIIATAKAKAKAEAKAKELEDKKEGNITVVIYVQATGQTHTIVIAKAKTIGKLKAKLVRRSGAFPSFGKKGGLRKDDLMLIGPSLVPLVPRSNIYNSEHLVQSHNPQLVAIESSAFNRSEFVFPTFVQNPAEAVVENDDEEGESSDEDDD